MTQPVKIRGAVEGDMNFMRKAWRETFQYGSLAVDGADKTHYFDEMTRLFAAIVPHASARVACDATDDDVRVGFACWTDHVLHYVYVQRDFRGHGLVAALLEDLPIKAYSFTTLQFVKRIKPLNRGWAFRPRFTYGS